MAHFNPAVTIGYLITKHISKKELMYYMGAEIVGALLASIFVKLAIGDYANLGANVPNYNFPLFLIFAVEVLASGLLMAVILIVVYTKGLKGFSGIANRRNCWIGYFLLCIYLRCLNESCKVFGPSIIVRFDW